MQSPIPRSAFTLAALLLFAAAIWSFPQETLATPMGPPTRQEDDEAEIQELVNDAVAGDESVLGYAVFNVSILAFDFSPERDWALVWLGYADRATGRILPTEPGLVLAMRSGVPARWKVVLPSSPDWLKQLDLVPESLLTEAAKESWRSRLGSHSAAQGGPYGGYLLPWPAGEQKFLTQSIGHGIGGSMHFAFDFAEIGFPSSMFPIYASKGGTVKWAIWTYPNGYSNSNCNLQNYIVLEHTETSPTTYSMYLHLAQDSIPVELRATGAVVHQGQLIGTADDTGCSSGNHLHIQTHTNPSSYWGTSVDMTFDDVPINGGRPRTVAEAAAFPQHGAQGQDLYTSGNTVWGDLDPPEGGLTSPQTGNILSSGTISIAGYAFDSESGLDEARLSAFYNGQWNLVGNPIGSSPFAINWDVCADRVPDGPVSLALNITDMQGNLADLEGLTHVTKDFNCPPQPPSCQPGSSQIALFSEVDYEGECVILGSGGHSTPVAWNPVGDDNTESILLGSGVIATLYSEDVFQGRSQTIFSDNSSLAEDRIGSDSLSSVRVLTTATTPTPPAPQWPSANQVLSDTRTLDLVWRDNGAGSQFQARISGTGVLTSSWLTHTHWVAGELGPGGYTWQIRAQNGQGMSDWSSPQPLVIAASVPITIPTAAAPFGEDFEGGAGSWDATGLWHWKDDPAYAHSGSRSFWFGADGSGGYNQPTPHSGDLTSPPISIPTTGYALRFWWRAETEAPYRHWDQRSVLISADGDPFQTYIQFAEDPSNFWGQSPALDLSEFAGKTIRVRFHFATLDSVENDFEGWIIDDVDVAPYTELVCADPNEPNGSAAQATILTWGSTTAGAICPPGDLDYFTFAGAAGQRVVLDVDAEVDGSSLDSYLSLLDGDQNSVLAQNDDEVPFVAHDSLIGYQLPRSGSYFVKLRAWDHLSAGGPAHDYSLHLFEDSTDPSLSVLSPAEGAVLTSTLVTLEAVATDTGSGMKSVAFLWHDDDWLGGDWQLLFEDTDGTDVWKYEFDPTSHPEGSGMGIFIQATDWAGNVTGRGLWNIAVDRTPPDTSVHAQPPTLQTTAVQLHWSGSDNASGIQSYDLQSRRDIDGWIEIQSGISPVVTELWFVGVPDHIYAFRSRGTDGGGNVESYPDDGDSLTYIASCSAPDSFENDDSPGLANAITPTLQVQTHNLCALGDTDWLSFEAAAQQHYRVIVYPTHPSSAARISLYLPDGATLLADAAAAAFGERTELGWTAPAAGEILIKIEHINPAVAGNAVSYLVWIAEGYGSYLPLAAR